MDVESALVNRLFVLFDVDVDVDGAEVDTDASFFSASFALGSRALESMDVIEFLSVLEDELGVVIIEAVDEHGIDSLHGLGELLTASCPADAMGEFCDTWRTAG